MDIDKLTADARHAVKLANEAARASDDGGSCNLDATILQLDKGLKYAPVEAALKAAGLSSAPPQKFRFHGGRGVMIFPPSHGQANKRYEANEALYSHLRAAGWPVTPWYQMD